MQTTPLRRHTLADDATERLRGWILAGRITPDDLLTEPMLAAALGVSRTPLRAAIARLRHEGLLDRESRRGFRITPANAAMVREIYPIIGALEAMALQLSAPDSLPPVGELRALNDRIHSTRVTRAVLFELDSSFHERLARGCGNARLLELLEHHRLLGRRVDGGAYRGLHARERSWREHAAIIDAIAAGDVDQASLLIQRHYRGGIDTVIDWLEKNR